MTPIEQMLGDKSIRLMSPEALLSQHKKDPLRKWGIPPQMPFTCSLALQIKNHIDHDNWNAQQ